MNRPNISFSSPEWIILEAWLQEELLETYKRLAGLSLQEQETQQLRGRAAFISQMLDFKNFPTRRP